VHGHHGPLDRRQVTFDQGPVQPVAPPATSARRPTITPSLAEGEVSESYARKICEWDDKLPRDCRDAADAILLAAARAGADLTGLVELAAEMYARSLPDREDDRPEETFEDRRVTVETTFGGAGVIGGT